MPLHTDLRPKNFDEIIGNAQLVRTLKGIVKQKNHPQCFLFHGQRGCGKTTLGRILANEFECNITEINVGDNRGIETARNIIKVLPYRPLIGKKNKAYIFDEVHMSNKEFQSALLKVTEEPPSHTIFICCTTDPQKLLPTFKSRFQTYQVNPLSPDEMEQLINRAAEFAQFEIRNKKVNELINVANGIPREALVLLNDLVGLSKAQIMRHSFNVIDENAQVIELIRSLISKERWGKVRKIILSLKDEEPESIRRAILGYCNKVLLNSDKPNIQIRIVMEIFSENTFFDSGREKLTICCSQAIEDE